MGCDYDYGRYGGWPVFYVESMVKARKAHWCIECLEPIAVGETYQRVRGKWDGEVRSIKTCAHCAKMRKEAIKKTDGELAFGQLGCWYAGEIEGVAERMDRERAAGRAELAPPKAKVGGNFGERDGHVNGRRAKRRTT